LGLPWLVRHGETHEHLIALLGSLLFTYAAMMLFAYLERHSRGTPESRLGAAYALAYACSILWVTANPTGKLEVLSMLQGEIVAVSSHDLRELLIIFTALSAALLLLNQQFLLVSFDRDSAKVMGKRVVLWDALLFGIMGTAISVGVLIVGPMLTFAFLIIPPLAARRFCGRMRSFFLISALFGGLSGLIGFYLSYRLDWPLAPTDILVAFILLVLGVLASKIRPISSP
jgi:ABC-type Mn2+/Zn2+ transport system permease subunit